MAEKAFHKACFGGDLAAVEKMLSGVSGPALAASRDKHGATGLQLAAFAGHTDIVRVVGAIAGTLEATDVTRFFFKTTHSGPASSHPQMTWFIVALLCQKNSRLCDPAFPHLPQAENCTALHNAVFRGQEGLALFGFAGLFIDSLALQRASMRYSR
jgi:hypothetical protein